MTEQEWNSLTVFTLDDAQALAEGIAAGVGRLAMPKAVRERLVNAIVGALCPLCEHGHPSVQVTVFAQAVAPHAEASGNSWGFFVVEKGSDGAAPRCADVFLYPEHAKRPYEPQP